jgi:hypothetical protein
VVALELAGAYPQDVANLSPESRILTGEPNAHEKDAVENFLNHEVCQEPSSSSTQSR